jgi:hypothetical protein
VRNFRKIIFPLFYSVIFFSNCNRDLSTVSENGIEHYSSYLSYDCGTKSFRGKAVAKKYCTDQQIQVLNNLEPLLEIKMMDIESVTLGVKKRDYKKDHPLDFDISYSPIRPSSNFEERAVSFQVEYKCNNGQINTAIHTNYLTLRLIDPQNIDASGIIACDGHQKLPLYFKKTRTYYSVFINSAKGEPIDTLHISSLEGDFRHQMYFLEDYTSGEYCIQLNLGSGNCKEIPLLIE